ncbi:hypothetical protein T459_12312 [Capsicum annuum]|uniref:Uncharacterized protein n=1 Tax=Capsicum annuum TaxID=4072 RepID=A0A2G2ZPF4_CAPAN|nr:hypothetical protein T459_12312 [Capsicum annuum]
MVDDHTQKRTPTPRAANAAYDDSEPQHMNYDDAETSPQRFISNVAQNLSENYDGTKISDDKVDETNLRNSQFIISDELLPNLNAYRRKSITTPLSAIREELTNEHLNDKKSESLVEDHYQLLPNMNADSSKSIIVHLYDNRELQTPVQKFRIRRSSKFMESPYMIKFGSTVVVLDEIKKLAEIIPLYLQACDFYDKKGIDLQNHPRYKDKDSSDMFDVLFKENLPQQSSGSLDFDLYMVIYAECLSYGHKILSNEFDPNALRTRYITLLWDYGTRKQEANVHSDVEAPLRPTRQSQITSVIEVFDV